MTPAAIIAAAKTPEFRAAGTDISERRRSGVSTGPLIDIAATPDTTGMQWGADGTLRIGASTSIATIAADALIAPLILVWPLRRKVLRRRRSGISRRWAATSRSVRAAGTFASRISPA